MICVVVNDVSILKAWSRTSSGCWLGARGGWLAPGHGLRIQHPQIAVALHH